MPRQQLWSLRPTVEFRDLIRAAKKAYEARNLQPKEKGLSDRAFVENMARLGIETLGLLPQD